MYIEKGTFDVKWTFEWCENGKFLFFQLSLQPFSALLIFDYFSIQDSGSYTQCGCGFLVCIAFVSMPGNTKELLTFYIGHNQVNFATIPATTPDLSFSLTYFSTLPDSQETFSILWCFSFCIWFLCSGFAFFLKKVFLCEENFLKFILENSFKLLKKSNNYY